MRELSAEYFEANRYMSDVVKYDVQSYSGDEASFALSASANKIGNVLYGVSTSRKYVRFTRTETPDKDVAAARLLMTSHAADADAVSLSRHPNIADYGLSCLSSSTAAENASARAEIATVSISSRKEVQRCKAQ